MVTFANPATAHYEILNFSVNLPTNPIREPGKNEEFGPRVAPKQGQASYGRQKSGLFPKPLQRSYDNLHQQIFLARSIPEKAEFFI